MNAIDLGAFKALFQEACQKCYGHAATASLTEVEARLFYSKVLDATGLVIGWKSIKNYSVFLFSPSASSAGKVENPSAATLDTLARYVAGAGYATEAERKAVAGHYPYWYGYREKWVRSHPAVVPEWRAMIAGLIFAGVMILLVIAGFWVFHFGEWTNVREDFRALSTDSLKARGWSVVAPDTLYWNKRASDSGGLTLYTLKGDNWPDGVHVPVIRNLLERRIAFENFLIEWHFDHFIPHQNWQQAGVLLSEGNDLNDPSVRVSIAYNDYNGVYPRSGMILLQAILCRGEGKPEEIAHIPLFIEDSLQRNPALAQSLEHTALRIVVKYGRMRILYADGILENSSFREVASYDLPFALNYVGLFALKGFVDSAENMPVRFSLFRMDRLPK